MEGRYLLGATPLEEAWRFLHHQYGLTLDRSELQTRMEAAEGLRRARPPLTADAAEPLPEWREHLEAVAARPLFRGLFQGQAWRFAAVPLAGLISVQPHLDFSHAQRRVGATPSSAAALELCLPVQPEAFELWGGIVEGDPPTASFFTRDPNVQITAARMETQPLRVTFTIGKTAVFVQVIRLDGRLYLKNGTHRAVALAAAGLRMLPCVLVEAPDADALPRLLALPTLTAPSPPLVVDFLTPGLHLSYPWTDRVKFIRLVPETFASMLPEPLEC